MKIYLFRYPKQKDLWWEKPYYFSVSYPIYPIRHNGCPQKIGDLPLANVDYVGSKKTTQSHNQGGRS